MRAVAFGLTAAVLVHLLVLGFGGLLFPRPDPDTQTAAVEEVDLLADDAERRDPQAETPPADPAEAASREAFEVGAEPPPDPSELVALQDQAAAAAVPALEALSLGALEAALNPSAGGGLDFGGGGSGLAGGGRIGGTASALEGPGADPGTTFSLPELDQKPRLLFQAPPLYPFELRRKNLEGTVYVLFVVDREGRVVNPTVEKSTHLAFEKPALDAVRQWKFEPAIRNGEPVQARLRVPIRFARG